MPFGNINHNSRISEAKRTHNLNERLKIVGVNIRTSRLDVEILPQSIPEGALMYLVKGKIKGMMMVMITMVMIEN